MKKYFGIAAGLGLLLVSAVPAMAADCLNESTGPLSVNKCTQTNRQKIRVRLSNTGSAHNHITSNTTTGGNEQDFNTAGGNIGTGPAEAEVATVVDMNENGVDVAQSNDEEAAIGTNSLTGPLSFNQVSQTNSRRIKVGIHNDGEVVNHIDANANTGENSSSYNTIGGSIQTGAATSSVTTTTTMNVNTVIVSQ